MARVLFELDLKRGLLVTTNEDHPHLQWASVISVDNLSSPNDLIVAITPSMVLPS